ncbi:MAG: UvrD-helicase domain-containing protein [Candidatus Uhrbacteria bacterium]
MRRTGIQSKKCANPAPPPISPLLADLNVEQRRAVTHEGGPLLIVAGAGTGKTTVIARRIAWLVLERGVPVDNILALTFTEKAATEMEERVDRLLPYGYVDLWISTFHGFCERILKRHALDIGLPNEPALLDETQAWLLMRQHLDRFALDYYRPRGNPTKFLHALHEHFSRCKDEAITPEDYLRYAKGLRLNADIEHGAPTPSRSPSRREGEKKSILPTSTMEGGRPVPTGLVPTEASGGRAEEPIDPGEIARIAEVANAYHVYQQILLEEGRMDFGDLLVYTLQLFRERPLILERYRRQFRHVLVDEFQDTNWAQYEIVKLLAPSAVARQAQTVALPNFLTVVADDDQAIYRWRGASMSNILHFKEDYKDAASVSIIENYRSRQGILDAAYRLIRKNDPNRLEVTLKLDKKLRAKIEGPGIIELLHARDASEEARLVVGRIRALYDEQSPSTKSQIPNKHQAPNSPPTTDPPKADKFQTGEPLTWNDFAILVRANRQADQFLPALDAAGIPYQFLASRGLYRKPIVLDILAYLNLLDDYHESSACFRVLNIPIFGFTYEELLALTSWSGRKARSLFETLRGVRAVPNIMPETVRKVEKILQLVTKHAELARTTSVRDVVLAFLTDSGYLKAITDEETAEDHATVAFLNQFWKRIESFEANTDEPTVRQFRELIDMEREAGDTGALPADPNEGPEAVKVLTVHAAKGLEFRYVFIVNLVEQRFPATDRSEPMAIPDALVKVIVPPGDIHIEEERRLGYVACTRAKEGLFLSYADDYGGKRMRKASRFIEELGIPLSRHSEERGDEESRKMVGGGNRVRSLASLGMTSRAIMPPTHALPAKLSFTQLRAYRTCPWQYHYAHVLRIPLRGRWTLSFGQTMHLTLQHFFDRVLERSSVQQSDLFTGVNHQSPNSSPTVDPRQRTGTAPQTDKFSIKGGSSPKDGRNAPGGQTPNFDELISIYEQRWIDDWYESPGDKREYFDNGKRMLKEFYERYAREGWPAVRATEQSFTVKFGCYGVIGKADRIDDLSDGGVEIIDYKTGRPQTALEAEDKLQLLIYQIAATQVLQLEPKILSYHYLVNNTKTSFLGTADELAGLDRIVRETGERIANGDFAPTPGRHCASCDSRKICPYAQ